MIIVTVRILILLLYNLHDSMIEAVVSSQTVLSTIVLAH